MKASDPCKIQVVNKACINHTIIFFICLNFMRDKLNMMYKKCHKHPASILYQFPLIYGSKNEINKNQFEINLYIKV